MVESEGKILKLLITSVKTQIKNIFMVLFTEQVGLVIFIYWDWRVYGHYVFFSSANEKINNIVCRNL